MVDDNDNDNDNNESGSTPKKREVVKHYLPNEYDGRCSETTNFSTFLTRGGKWAEGEIMHKYEICLPIPESDEEAKDFYDLTLQEIVYMGIAKLATTIDDKVKPSLFIEGEADVESHLAGQEVADSWRYAPRVARGKSIEVTEIVRGLVAAGKLTESEADGIETKADLMKALL